MTDINPALEAAITDLHSLRGIIALLKQHYPEVQSVTVRHSVWIRIVEDVRATALNRGDNDAEIHNLKIDGLLVQPRRANT